MLKGKRIVNVSVLPGQPLDGSGKVCIHLFVKDDKGSFTEPHVLHSQVDDEGQVVKGRPIAKPTCGRIACDSKRVPTGPNRKGVITPLTRTDDARAVTCPSCMKSEEYASLIKQLENN